MQVALSSLKRARRAGMLGSAFLTVVCLVCVPAFAQNRDEYRTLTAAAVEEHSLGHFEEARALFAKAHAINPNARTFWGMGMAAFEARQYVDAIELLQAARADTRKPLTEAQRKQTDLFIERSQAFVVRVPVRVQPPHAVVSMDGREVTLDSGGTVLLDAGTHQVVASADGYESVVRMMRWSPGTAPLLELRLEKQRAEPADTPPAPQAAATSSDLPPPSPAVQPKRPGPFRALKWVSLGVTVASLGVMSASIALRQSAAAEWNDDAKCPHPKDENCADARDEAHAWKTAAIAGGAASGVFAALTIVFFALDGRAPAEGVAARVQCAPGLALGATCQVRF